MNHSPSATRTFLIACSIVVAGAVGWRLLAPRTAQGPIPVSAQSGPPQTPTSRNIIVFETDDQRWDTLFRDIDPDTSGDQYAMPNVRDFFIDNGIYFPNAVVTNPTCCPCRASQQSGGFYSHNTGVLTNTWPNGGALRFEDENALAVRMKDTDYIDEAYYTALIGKYMNGYEELIAPGQDEKARYIPPGWDVFIVVSDSRDWDRDYKITVGGNGVQDPVGVILPDDTRTKVDGQWVDNWELSGGVRARLTEMDVPDDVIGELKVRFPFVSDESQRAYDYVPEVEVSLAEALLEGLPNPQTAPLFMMLTMAPPHGPTQLDAEFIDCDGDGEPTQNFLYSDRAYGEVDVSDKPSWMQDNYDVFQDYDECKKSLLHCYRGPGCTGQDCSGDEGDCDPDEDPDVNRDYRALQQVFRDELGSLLIVDEFIGGTNGLLSVAPVNTVFFFTSDHGTMWGEHGSFQKGIPYEESIRVPFAVAGNEGTDIRQGVVVNAMIAMDLDMPATILEIAGYTRNEISNPGTMVPGLIKSDGCSLLGILEGTSWGDCYTNAPSGLLPRSQVLIQSFRNLAPNATPCWAGLRLDLVQSLPRRKYVITDTHEEEYYELDIGAPDYDYELDNLICSNPPAEVDDLRDDINVERGLVITLDHPSIVDWDLPMGIPGQAYSVTFKAEGGVPSPSSPTYTWCLWNFSDGTPTDCDACSDPGDLGCLFDGVEQNGDSDCEAWSSQGTGLTFTASGATATLSGTYAGAEETCYEFVLAVMDGSVSRYTGEPQKYLRRFRIETGVELNTSDGDGYDAYVPEDTQAPACGEDTLIVSKDGTGSNDGNVVFLRFDREEAEIQGGWRATGGELILRAATDLLDASLYYVEEPGAPDCEIQYESFPDCTQTTKPDWDDWETVRDNDHLVPITRICSIEAEQYIRFDVTPYLTNRYLDCVNQVPYYQFVITSNEAATGRGFYGGAGDAEDAPRLAFTYTSFSTGNENNQRCEDCRDNDCDGVVDCEDTAQCDPCP